MASNEYIGLFSIVNHFSNRHPALKIFYHSFQVLKRNDPLRMGGATAFFTSFALPPILIIIISSLGVFTGPEFISKRMSERLGNFIGKESSDQVIRTLHGFQNLLMNPLETIIGGLILIFIATTLFNVIKNSINQLWEIKVEESPGMKYRIANRLTSLFVIAIAAVLFSTGLIVESSELLFGAKISEILPFDENIQWIISSITTFIMVTLWFAFLFRFLPDGRASLRIIFIGSTLTSLLFNAGKILFRHLLSSERVNAIYGASGAIVLLLLFVFYGSLILYYGASFIRELSTHYIKPIKPLKHARRFRIAGTVHRYVVGKGKQHPGTPE